jgi:4a-hydroxytetrahydrobiopterin dehydratase
MSDTEKHCQACEGGVALLEADQVKQGLKDLSDWQYDEAGKRIFKRFGFKNFLRTMSFMNAVAWVANQEKHHPDCCLGYDYCEVAFQTHSAGGVTDNDLICARLVERLL